VWKRRSNPRYPCKTPRCRAVQALSGHCVEEPSTGCHGDSGAARSGAAPLLTGAPRPQGTRGPGGSRPHPRRRRRRRA
jgi:hypothetical protein